MGYRRSLDLHEMVFEAGDLTGLTISVLELSAKETLAMADFDLSDPLPVIKLFLSKVVAWNLDDDDGRRVPITRKGFMSRDLDFVEAILRAWKTHVISLRHGQTTALTHTRPAADDVPYGGEPHEDAELISSLPMRALPDPAEEPDIIEAVPDAVGA